MPIIGHSKSKRKSILHVQCYVHTLPLFDGDSLGEEEVYMYKEGMGSHFQGDELLINFSSYIKMYEVQLFGASGGYMTVQWNL